MAVRAAPEAGWDARPARRWRADDLCVRGRCAVVWEQL
eukprot:COSAG03_NODE_15733_length_422_cov_0.643963_2_plen_37_part_01